MKIGILTFHRAHNYGAVLQCYALLQCLKGLGHDVWTIDYRQPFIEQAYRAFDMRRWLGMAARLQKQSLSYLYRYPARQAQKYYFERFVGSHLHPTPACTADTIPQDFDAYIIGSDQLWNWEYVGNRVDNVFLGQFTRNASGKLYGYAISSNRRSLEAVGAQALKQVIARFDAISMREDSVSKAIHNLTGSMPSVCCDPTLLTDASTWEAITHDKYRNRKYVLAYQVGRPRGSRTLLFSKAKALARELRCETILVDMASARLSVEDFVSLFKYARYVVCTSFHGTAFSLIFERPFYVLQSLRDTDDRFAGLLRCIGAAERCVRPDASLEPLPMDYTPIRRALHSYREQSLQFLADIQRIG